MVTQVTTCENWECSLHGNNCFHEPRIGAHQRTDNTRTLGDNCVVWWHKDSVLSLIYNSLYERVIINSNGPVGNKGTVLIDLIDLYTWCHNMSMDETEQPVSWIKTLLNHMDDPLTLLYRTISSVIVIEVNIFRVIF